MPLQILMDNNSRETYDLFGADGLKFDPRNDELHLMLGVFSAYTCWWVILFVVTIPKQARSARGWSQLALLLMMLVEVFVYLADLRIPFKDTIPMTEYEFINLLHSLFPFVMAILFCYSSHIYQDSDGLLAEFVETTARTQKVSRSDFT